MITIMEIGSKHKVKKKKRNGHIDWEMGMNSQKTLSYEKMLKLCPKI